MKKLIEEFLDTVSMSELSGSIDDIRKTLDRIEKNYEGSGDIFIRENYYQETPIYSIVESRLETDEEYNKRIAKEEEDKECRRKLYLRLQKEFGTE